MKVRDRQKGASSWGPVVCRAMHSIPFMERGTERDRTSGQMRKQKC